MKIKNVLKNYDKDLSLKVGAKDGTAFFYVGTVGDFLENMDVYDSVMRNRTVRIQIRAERAYENEIRNAPTLEGYARECIKKEEPLIYSDYRASIEDWFMRVTQKHNTALKKKAAAANYRKLSGREVKEYEMCDKTIDDNCLRVVIEGYETGAYWCLEEAATLPSLEFTRATSGEDEEDG